MKNSILCIRAVFVLLSILFLSAYFVTTSGEGLTLPNIGAGAAVGVLFALAIFGIELLFKRFELQGFNTAILGLFFGYLMGQAVVLVFQTAINLSAIPITFTAPLTAGIFLCTCYLGMVMTARAANELSASIPFVKFKTVVQHEKKDLFLDNTILTDPRLIDLATSGLLDHHLVLPSFLQKELQRLADSTDESTNIKAKRALDVIKKLEKIPTLGLRCTNIEAPEANDLSGQLLSAAAASNANVLTADITHLQETSQDGVRMINIHSLAKALKPITQAGEQITIKIQRYGKEARQGVGYLEDGTMVVVNGGAEFIGESIKAQVLSVKHTASGRMIFCNTNGEEELEHLASAQSTPKNYFSL